jgi:hypothetical protein
MKKLTLLLGATLLMPLHPADAGTMRPAVAKHLLQAETYLDAKNYSAALSEVNAAQAVGGLSPDERLAIAQLRGTAASGTGNYELAAQSYEIVLSSDNEPPATQLLLLQAIAGFYAHAADYPHTVVWVDKYVAAGGKDPQIRALAAQAEYGQGHYATALRDAQRDQATGGAPIAELQLAASAAQKAGNNQAYFESLQALLVASPTTDEWNAAIALVQADPNFPDGLTLSAERLRLATGTLTAPEDYEDYAERAILAGQPAEAERVLDAGFANGILTAQTDAGHATRLLALAKNQAAAPQNAATVQATPLDAAIARGKGFEAVPGYAQGQLDDSQGALARLWKIQSTASPK